MKSIAARCLVESLPKESRKKQTLAFILRIQGAVQLELWSRSFYTGFAKITLEANYSSPLPTQRDYNLIASERFSLLGVWQSTCYRDWRQRQGATDFQAMATRRVSVGPTSRRQLAAVSRLPDAIENQTTRR
jgi:hypothetical protein